MLDMFTFDHKVLFHFAFLWMFTFNLIILGYYFFGNKPKHVPYLVLGNLSYTLFFFVVAMELGLKFKFTPVVVGCLDLTAVILWMMSINKLRHIKQPKLYYCLVSVINIVVLTGLRMASYQVSVIRAMTSLLVVLVVIYTGWHLWKDKEIKELSTSKFSAYMMVAYFVFKIVMSFYRLWSMQYEVSIESIEVSINVLTFTSLVFAFWINFAVSYLN